jgi:predicted acyltransferase
LAQALTLACRVGPCLLPSRLRCATSWSRLLAATLWSIRAGSGDLQQWLYAPIARGSRTAPAALVWSLLFTAICWLAVYALYRRRIFAKV